MSSPEDPYRQARSEEQANQQLSPEGHILVFALENFLARQQVIPEMKTPRLVPYEVREPFMDAPLFVSRAKRDDVQVTHVSVEYDGFTPGFKRLGKFVLDSISGNKTVCAALCAIAGRLSPGRLHAQVQRRESQPAITLVHDERI